MKIIAENEYPKDLLGGFKEFKMNWKTALLTICFFPLVLFYSYHFIKAFLGLCFSYPRTGKIIEHDNIDMNSFDYYFLDCKVKGLDRFGYIFDPATLDYQELSVLNDNQEAISCLKIMQPETKKTNKWVIGFHGWTENKYLGLRLVWWFYQQGYNVLTFDSMAHGKSYGQFTDIGFTSAHDIDILIDYIKTIDKTATVGLVGNSMGAACINYYNLKLKKRHNIDFVISDAGFSSLLVQYRYVMQHRYQMPWWMITFGLRKQHKRFTNNNIKDYHCFGNQVDGTKTLLIHGKADTFVPFFHSQEIYNYQKKKGTPKIELLSLAGVEHVQALYKSHEEYVNKVAEFLEITPITPKKR